MKTKFTTFIIANSVASAIPEKCKTHISISNKAKGVSHFKAVVKYLDSVSFFIMIYLRFIIVFSDFLSAVGAELGLSKQSIIDLATMRTTYSIQLVAHN